MLLLQLLSSALLLALGCSGKRVEVYDYIVIGAGAAGCPAATRLAEAGHSVLLVEEGSWDTSQDATLDRLAPRQSFDQWERPKTSHRYLSEPNIFGNRVDVLYGKGPGGTTLINAGLYTRPSLSDFDEWQLGGWSSSEVLPFFMRMEDFQNPNAADQGQGGPLHIELPLEVQSTATPMAGYLNATGFTQFDAGTTLPLPFTFFESLLIRTPLGARLDAYSAYVVPYLKKATNLKVLLDTKAIKILFEDHPNGKVAIGAVLVSNGRREFTVLASKEVVISAGPYETPRLLMLSGIGDPSELTPMGISVEISLPQVGENMITRPLYTLGYTGTSLLPEQNFTRAFDPLEVQKFYQGLGGYFAYPINGLFGYGAANLSNPDVDFMFEHSVTAPFGLVPFPTAMTFACIPSKVKSLGTVKLRSTDPYDPLSVDPKMYSNTEDLGVMIACIETFRAVASVPGASSVLGQEFIPGSTVQGADLIGAVMATSRSAYHTFGTCKMGTDSSNSVVNPRLLVHGTQNLRIADSSVIPRSIRSGPQATTYMIGERVSDFILSDNFQNPINFTRGYNLCEVGDFTVIMDELQGDEANSACDSIFMKSLSATDPNLTCSSQAAVDAMNTCNVSEAYVRQRGFICSSLSTSSGLNQNALCSTKLPVICFA